MSRLKIAGIVAAIAALAAVIVIVALYAAPSSKHESPSEPEKVRLEIRSNQIADITMNGKKIGKTPLGIYLPKSSQAVEIRATAELHLYTPKGRPAEDNLRMERRMVVPDRDMLIDFVITAHSPSSAP